MAQITLNGLNGFTLPCREPAGQGRQANESGQAAEDTIYCILLQRGYTVQRQYEACHSVYNTPIRVDFFVTGIARFPDGLIIESKWQEKGGSVDEKFPYLIENVQSRYPCPAIIVFGGGGARSGAVEWLKSQIGGNLIGAFSFDEFLAWSIRNL